ncbi:hypothetical protein [Actinoplanes flavus]|uniref:DUF3703 domain-containing protein n=1 Tax=Actinoplanes flavus TaxID=2820290 RepID=A0ABS3UEA4_9ACTN|nr:hypothetical protein [Actinoplanes flavus]MBO3737100.1 hypothetical protein [Actinoplanes flavus]
MTTHDWHARALAAEERKDWDEAITLVSAHAECFSADHYRHNSHLWHMRLLALAGRRPELEQLATTDSHARRALGRTEDPRDH